MINSATVKVLVGDQSAVGTVVGLAPQDDLALVRTDKPFPGHVFEVAGRTPDVGQAVVALGYPLSGPLSMTAPGVVSNLDVDVDYRSVGLEVNGLMQMDLATNSGNSGGPVLDPVRRLVGVVSGGSGAYLVPDADTGDASVVDVDGIKYATPAGTVAARLTQWQQVPERHSAASCEAPDDTDDPGADVADLVTTTVADPESPDVVAMFSDYTYGINSSDYPPAYEQLSQRRRDAQPLQEFADQQKSSTFSDFVVLSLVREDDSLLATTAFTTHQDAADAPDGSGLTCTFWTFDWVLVPGGDHGWQIDGSREIDGTPRYSACSE